MSGGATSIAVRVAARDLDVAFAVAHGECVALIGANGAGKSTVVEVVAGLLRPDGGDVDVAGTPVLSAGRVVVPAHRRRIGLVGQDPSLFPHRSVLGNVAYGPRAAGASRRAATERGRRALASVGAGAFADRMPSTLSGGQAQRVAIARALATDPALLLLDEPTSALDLGARDEVRRALAEAVHGRTTLLVTHDPVEVVTLADRVVVLDHGRIVEAGPVDTVLRRPTSAFGAAFSGLVLLRGTATPRGIRLTDGTELVSGTHPVPPGRPAFATYHPTAARIAPGGGHGRAVERFEPRDGLVRVIAGDLVVDATVAAVAAAGVEVGGPVHVDVPVDEITVYPAEADRIRP